VGLAGLVAGVGLGGSLVRLIPSVLAKDGTQEVSALRRAAWWLFWGFGSLAFLVLFFFRVPISRIVLGGPEHAGVVALMGAALFLSLASGIQASILNAYHRIGALAQLGVLNSILGAGSSITLIGLFGEDGIPFAIVTGAVVSFSLSRLFLRRAEKDNLPRATWRDTIRAARSLLLFGVPLTGSQVVGEGARLALPLVVVSMLDKESVGFFGAASAIAVTYMGFLVKAMGQDYFPRVSAAVDDPHELARLANQQLRLVLLLGVPLILGVSAMSSIVIPLVYSPAFIPAVAVLQWQLAGDVLKLPTWVIGFMILVRTSRKYFTVELLAGVFLLAFSWLGITMFGLVGIGIGWLAMYVVILPVNFYVARKDLPLEWTRDNRFLFLGSVLAVGVVQSLALISPGRWHMLGGAIAAGAFGFRSVLALRSDSRLENRSVKRQGGA